MLRIKTNHEISSCIVDGQATITGYDYKNQAWILAAFTSVAGILSL